MKVEQSHDIESIIKKYQIQQLNMDLSTQQSKQVQIKQLFSFTNDVYKVTISSNTPVVIKIYKPTLQQFSNPQLEVQIVTYLSQHNLYPKIIYKCSFYRIQNMLCSKEISPQSLSKDNIINIIRLLANFSCNYRYRCQDYNKNTGTRSPFLYSSLIQIYDKVYKLKMSQCPQIVKDVQVNLDLIFKNQQFCKEIQGILSQMPLIFSHNDSHLGNILIQNDKQYLLDYEWSQFNYIGYDLGNFFNQWTCQYQQPFQINTNKEIPKQLQEQIIREYSGIISKQYKIDISFKKWCFYVQVGRVMSHLLFLIVGLKQINHKKIQFCMKQYVRRRQEQIIKRWQIVKQMMSNKQCYQAEA